MDDASFIRAIETVNARALELRTSKEYTDGVRKGNIERLFSDISPAGIHRAFEEYRTYREFSKAPFHPGPPNLTPEEWEASLRPGNPTKKVVVYTCIAGRYDTPQPPLFQSERISYVLFSNEECYKDAIGWEWRPFPDKATSFGSNAMANRYLKLHPHELFAGKFDASVYVDGNVQPVSDLSYYADLIDPCAGFTMHKHRERDTIAAEAIACKALGKGNASAMDLEIQYYVSQGFPLEYGLLENNIIATDLHSTVAQDILTDWWETVNRMGSGRDQISLPYVLWKHHIPFEAMTAMGRNPYRDTKLFIGNHR